MVFMTEAGWWGDTALGRVAREGPNEELTFELRPDQREVGHEHIWGQHPRGGSSRSLRQEQA